MRLLFLIAAVLLVLSCTRQDTTTVTGEMRVLQGVATITLCDTVQTYTLRQGSRLESLIANYDAQLQRAGDGMMVEVQLVPADYLNESGSKWIQAWEVQQYQMLEVAVCHTVDGSKVAGRYEGTAGSGDQVMLVLGFNGNALLRTTAAGNTTTEPGRWMAVDNETLQLVCNTTDTLQIRLTWDGLLVEEAGRYGAGGMVLGKKNAAQ